MVDQMTKNQRVVVIGAGLAGSTAALRAAQLGCEVTLIDSAPDATAGGNTAMSGGGVHVTHQDLRSDPGVLRNSVLGRGWGHTRLPLVDAFVSNAPHAHRWLTETGVRFQSKDVGRLTDPIPADTILDPKRDMGDVHAWPDRGPQQALRTIQDTLRRAGGRVCESTSAVALSRDSGGRIDGVVVDRPGTIHARSVLLADGGFQANHSLRRRFIGPRADRLFMRGATSGRGAGLLMAEEVGARIANPQWFYGHVLHRDVLDNDRLWPWPSLDGMLLKGGILVDARGQRFTDEGRGGIHIANALGWSDDPAGAWVIANSTVWGKCGALVSTDPVPSNPGLEERGARIIRTDTVELLAAETGIDPHRLAETLTTYNAAAAAGRTGELPVLRSRNALVLDGELLAFPVVAGITFTMGGVSNDADARVLDADATPIPGLLAAGGTAAGPTAGYIGGLATALTFGYIAGTTLAAE
jgi:fumarate reductase flavoprotein subunit